MISYGIFFWKEACILAVAVWLPLKVCTVLSKSISYGALDKITYTYTYYYINMYMNIHIM